MKDDQWMIGAACAGHPDPDMFFLKKSANHENAVKIKRAKALCERCPVRRECLKYAIAHNQTDGIWGGMTVHERRRYFPKRVRLLIRDWWFYTHPGAHPLTPPSEHAPRSERTAS